MWTHKSILIVLSVLFLAPILPLHDFPTVNAPAVLAQSARATTAPPLLQFTAGGHILGFTSTGVYVAAGNHSLDIDFVGAKNVQPHSQVPNTQGQAAPLNRVLYSDLWRGIRLTYDASGSGILRSTYQLEPGADVSAIQLHYNAPLTLNADGRLSIVYDTGTLTESAPLAWQVIDGQTVSVAVNFTQHENNIGFALGQYDARYPLTIDPTLTWNTFLGGSGYDWGGSGIAVDTDGNVYVVGNSGAAWSCSPVPCTVRPFNPGPSNYQDAFVAKLNSSGVLQWNTFLGAGYGDSGTAITVDTNGNLYVMGNSNGDWSCSPVSCTVRHTSMGAPDFVAKLNSSDGALQWNTFLDAVVSLYGTGIALDDGGNIYVTGVSDWAWSCPVNCTVRSFSGDADAYVAKLNSSGELQWNTFLGGTAEDKGRSIAVSGGGYVFVMGYSYAAWGTPVRAYTVGDDSIHHNPDAFVAKLDSGGALQWNTFLGGSGDDEGNYGYGGIAADANDNAYVAGDSTSAWSCAPTSCTVRALTTDSMFQRDAFVAKVDSNGVLQWNTFLGGHTEDEGSAIVLDSSGNIYVAGNSSHTWGTHSGELNGTDAFAAKLNASGALQWNTFLGDKGYNKGDAIALDHAGNVYVAGESDFSWGSPVRSFNANHDVFAAKLSPITSQELKFNSIGTQDGWILESSENSNKGGTLNTTADTLYLGDNAAKKQYRSILSFSTGSKLPDDAVITSVTLRIKKQGVIGGGNPITTFQGFMVDLKKGLFGKAALQAADFQTAADMSLGPFTPASVGKWYAIDLTAAQANINKLETRSGITQIRLRFQLDDNNNSTANYLSIYSGNANPASAPQLIVDYYLP